jgi:hypothetical protein
VQHLAGLAESVHEVKRLWITPLVTQNAIRLTQALQSDSETLLHASIVAR